MIYPNAPSHLCRSIFMARSRYLDKQLSRKGVTAKWIDGPGAHRGRGSGGLTVNSTHTRPRRNRRRTPPNGESKYAAVKT